MSCGRRRRHRSYSEGLYAYSSERSPESADATGDLRTRAEYRNSSHGTLRARLMGSRCPDREHGGSRVSRPRVSMQTATPRVAEGIRMLWTFALTRRRSQVRGPQRPLRKGVFGSHSSARVSCVGSRSRRRALRMPGRLAEPPPAHEVSAEATREHQRAVTDLRRRRRWCLVLAACSKGVVTEVERRTPAGVYPVNAGVTITAAAGPGTQGGRGICVAGALVRQASTVSPAWTIWAPWANDAA